MKNEDLFDVIVIGGSNAGLAAALGLGRAIRRVLVLDSGQPCNRHTPHSHNFLTQDGSTPAAMAAIARAQVLAYPTVQIRDEAAVAVTGTDNNFTVITAAGTVVRARKLLFATGVRDLMPAIPGFAESWGISVIHCPYCHGYEYRDQPTGVLLSGDMVVEWSRVLRNWTDKLTIFANGPAGISPELLPQLATRGIALEETPLREIRHEQGYLTHVVLADERMLPLSALYARPAFEQQCSLPQVLGCAMTDAGHLVVDESQKTSVAGVFAAGDATTMRRAVAIAVAAGTMAAVGLNHELLYD